jgi:hypothetical protein
MNLYAYNGVKLKHLNKNAIKNGDFIELYGGFREWLRFHP